MDTLILQDRQPQVGARSWKQQSGGRKGEWDFIFPADKLCNRQTMVSRPEESNLTGISSKMTAMQVDQDVTPWISRDTQSKVVWDCWQQHGCMPNAEHTLTHMQILSTYVYIWNHMQMLHIFSSYTGHYLWATTKYIQMIYLFCCIMLIIIAVVVVIILLIIVHLDPR